MQTVQDGKIRVYSGRKSLEADEQANSGKAGRRAIYSYRICNEAVEKQQDIPEDGQGSSAP